MVLEGVEVKQNREKKEGKKKKKERKRKGNRKRSEGPSLFIVVKLNHTGGK